MLLKIYILNNIILGSTDPNYPQEKGRFSQLFICY